MLTVTKLADAEYVIGKVAMGIDEYYVGSGEAPGVWHGRLAAELGLEGVVDHDALRALVLGLEPGTGVDLLAGRPERKVAAFDLTFSAPKAVSLLWAFASPEVSAAASIAHVEAVAVALDFLERRAGATRQQVDGERLRIPTGLAVATFVHRTSREGDPQLHTHCVAANLGRRHDGSYAALDAAPLYEWGKAAGCVYQEELRRRLTEELGVEWGANRNGCREIEGFVGEWLRTFSKRTVAIEEHLAGAGPEHPDPATRMRANDAASLATRPAKDGSFTPESLRERWEQEAAEVGLPRGYALEAQVCGRVLSAPELTSDEVVEALIDPEDGLCARRTRFGEAHVVEQVAALGAGRLDVEEIEGLADGFLASGEAVPLVDRTGRRSPQYSTADHLDMEQRVLDHLDTLTGTNGAAIDRTIVEAAIAAEEPGLGADQAAAVRALCGPGPALRALVAPAGFGKTTAVHAAATAATRAGRPVVGLAATNQAAGELRQAGVPAMTIARFALNGAGLRPGTVVVLDEISQVATADAETVLSAVASTAAAQLWCLGDPHQAQPVRAGGLGGEITRLAAEGRLAAPALTENRRQQEPAEREALAHYREGHIAVSQAIRRNHGWEHDLGSPHATREALADTVAADIATRGSVAVVALAISHADCEDVGDRIRARLRAAGTITGPELVGPAWGHGERRYAAGDRVLVHGTLRTGGQRLHNGTVLGVVVVTGQALHTMDDHGRAVTLPRGFVEGRRSDGSPNLSHSWVRTVDGIQGGTWTQVHLLGTVALQRFTGYVGQSRGQCATHTWNVTRLPQVDHGGVAADERAPDQEVLDALLRVPDTGFATHDTVQEIQRLLAEQAEHRAILASPPVDLRRHLARAEDALRYARTEHHWVHHRLNAAHERLADIGPLAVLRKSGRHDKQRILEDIERFEGDVATATLKIERCEQTVDDLQSKIAHGDAWHDQNRWRYTRLGAIGAELTDLGHEPPPERLAGPAHDRGCLSNRNPDLTSGWADRLAEIARPVPAGPDLGIDLGL